MMRLRFVIFLFYCGRVVWGAATECTKSEDCLIESAVCTNSTCVCPVDHVFNSERTKCLQVSHGYGAACSDSIQCSASLKSGGYCANGTCECTNGYHYFVGQCWKTAGLGEVCTLDLNCFVGNDFEAAVCSEGVCVCTAGYYQREYSSCRRTSQKAGEPCAIALDCKFDHAVCTRDRVCAIESQVTVPATLQDEISSDQVQSTNHINKRAIITAQSSVPATQFGPIGGQCSSSADCPKNAECFQQSICLCLQGYYTTDNVTCHPELGGNCTEDKECIGKNSMCRDGKYCVCKQGFVTSHDNRYCDKMSRNISWSCLRDEQCGLMGPGAVCVSKKCQCSEETHWYPEQLYCWVTKKVGDKCENAEDCGGKDSSMSCGEDHVCSCSSGTHPSSSRTTCNKDSNSVGQPCKETIDCMYDHAQCNTTSSKCTCQSGYIKKNTACAPGINGTCKSDEECSVKNSHCLNSTCVCDKDYVPSKSLGQCLHMANTIGVQCQESDQCTLISGDCISGKCLCNNASQYLPEYKKCYLTRKIGERCNRSQNCNIRHAECSNGWCVCKRGYVPRRNMTECSSNGHVVNPYYLFILISTIIPILLNTFM